MATYKNTAGTANPEKRDKPRVNVLRGYPGNETTALTRSLPCSVAIKSGQAIAVGSGNNAGQWVLAAQSHAANKVFIAYHDSSDPDVISCGKLLGFSALGGFELETGYYSGTVADGDALTLSGTPGTIEKKNQGTHVIGYATSAPIDYSTGAYDANIPNMARNTEAGAGADSTVLRFATGA
tara:strand:- start:450 stop:992 length:543 start_codon:yes stop_codon:yes gene_type:complete